MRKHLRIPILVALTLALAIPVLAQTTHDQHAAAPAAAAPAVDPDKAYLLHEEFVAKTAELRGKITARQAELETLLVTKPGDEAAIKKLAADISSLRGALFEQTTLFRLRYAKETGQPIRLTRGIDHMGPHGGMMAGGNQDMCGGKDKGAMPGKAMMMDMMMGKGMMMGQGAAAPADAAKPAAPAPAAQ